MASNGNSQSQSIEVLGQRVSAIESSVNKLTNTVDNYIQRSQENSKTPWGLIISAMMAGWVIFGGIGWLAYSPVRENQTRYESAMVTMATAQAALVETLRTDYLSRDEADTRARRSEEDRRRVDDRMLRFETYLSEKIVARPEHEEKWRSSEQRFADVQRQIDEVKRLYGETYNARDIIQNLQAKMDRLEAELRAKP